VGSHKGSTPEVENESYSFDPQNEFVARAKGALPETITETDLDALNSGLQFFFADLREAQRRFEAEEDGRLGAFTALGAMWRFIMLFKAPHAEALQVPIIRLQDALAMLENNLVMPMLKPRPRPGRAPSSHAHATLRGNAAGTVQLLWKTGLDRQQACRVVANQLKELGVRSERGSGNVTANTVRHWCEEVAGDVGRHGTAAMAYDSMLSGIEPKISALMQEQARRWALDSLTAFVQRLFPEMHTTRKNPVKPPI
jgi:hypothetical protein